MTLAEAPAVPAARRGETGSARSERERQPRAMTLAIIDYGSGNLRSAARAFARAASTLDRPVEVAVTDDPEAVRRAERIVLPGVGAFADCRRGLEALPGMLEALEEAVIRRARPFLGICVGMQLMAERGLEHGCHPGFGWLAGEVRALSPAPRDGTPRKVPHMGWNRLEPRIAHPLLADLGSDPYVYFVHSYHFVPARPDEVLARVDYGGPIAAAVGRDNLVGTQFHPEKSQAVGLALIRNFLRWQP